VNSVSRLQFTLAVAAVALAVPLITGGSWARLASVRWNQAGLLALGVGIQVALEFIDFTESTRALGLGLLVASYVLILGFVGANLIQTGMAIVALGLLANAVTITVNDGMPVDTVWSDQRIEHTALRHAYSPTDDDLRWLSAIVPVPGVREMVSFADLVVLVGIADVAFHASRKLRRTPKVATVLPRGSGVRVPTVDLIPNQVDLAAAERAESSAGDLAGSVAGDEVVDDHGVERVEDIGVETGRPEA
jgi:Family of unknown function (DUF5317)